jgi:uncharacterized ubiquitin-like protein YukD
MASITNRVLTISHDHVKKLAKVTVKCDVNFTDLELCQMKTCEKSKLFKLKCQLWGSDSGLTFGDDFLYTFPTVRYYPDSSPASTEHALFEETLGEGVLDEDWGEDEVYGKLILTNLASLVRVIKNTNTVSHSF